MGRKLSGRSIKVKVCCVLSPLDIQGQFVEAIMILSMDGDNLSTLLSVADGQFTAAGVGTRAES